jgi:hypothetical protein
MNGFSAASSAAIQAARSPNIARAATHATGTRTSAQTTDIAWVSASPLPKTLIHTLSSR